jgi:hypothetical protein
MNVRPIQQTAEALASSGQLLAQRSADPWAATSGA